MSGSSGKPVLPPFHLVYAASMATSVTSPVSDIRGIDNVVYFASWTGTPTGTFAVQVSVDYDRLTNPGTWQSLTLTSSITATGAADTAVIELNQLSFPYVRLLYTASSGTGTLDAYVAGKGV